jgi:Tfp pilus assembly protein PilN
MDTRIKTQELGDQLRDSIRKGQQLAAHTLRPRLQEATARAQVLAQRLPGRDQLTARAQVLAQRLPGRDQLTARAQQLAGRLPAKGQLTATASSLVARLPRADFADRLRAVRQKAGRVATAVPALGKAARPGASGATQPGTAEAGRPTDDQG